jgi:hypothetical protein
MRGRLMAAALMCLAIAMPFLGADVEGKWIAKVVGQGQGERA